MRTFLLLVLVIILSTGTSWYMARKAGPAAVAEETAYARVMRTDTIRCAYWTLPPIAVRDPNTGKLGGLTVALFEDIAKRLELNIEWVEEVNFANMVEGLKTRRYDSICTGSWLGAARGREVEYTAPYMYSAVVPAVRAGDTRFDAALEALDNPAVKIAVQDDELSQILASEFPKAVALSVPSTAGVAQLYMDVESGKADATLADIGNFFDYNKKNPGKLKLVHTDRPVRVYPWVYPVAKGEHELASMLDAAVQEQIYNRQVQKTVVEQGLSIGMYQYVVPSVGQQ
ncbi:MAG: transporter substrate-binding domain-containing protein [Bdellovibrionales bacterium]